MNIAVSIIVTGRGVPRKRMNKSAIYVTYSKINNRAKNNTATLTRQYE